jgi:hypothetical protein
MSLLIHNDATSTPSFPVVVDAASIGGGVRSVAKLLPPLNILVRERSDTEVRFTQIMQFSLFGRQRGTYRDRVEKTPSRTVLHRVQGHGLHSFYLGWTHWVSLDRTPEAPRQLLNRLHNLGRIGPNITPKADYSRS